MKQLKLVAVLVGLFTGAPVVAHETGADHAMGVVESITPDRIAVKTADGHTVPFVVTRETRFTRGEKAVVAGDVRVGERVAVHGKRAGDALQAVQVKLGGASGKK